MNIKEKRMEMMQNLSKQGFINLKELNNHLEKLSNGDIIDKMIFDMEMNSLFKLLDTLIEDSEFEEKPKHLNTN